MGVKAAIVALILAAGVLVELAACIAFALFRTPLQRLHAMGAGSVTGPALILGAVAIARNPWSAAGAKALTIFIILAGGSVIVSHALARAAFVRLQAAPDGERR